MSTPIHKLLAYHSRASRSPSRSSAHTCTTTQSGARSHSHRDGTARMRSVGSARLVHHAGANDAPHVRRAVVARELCFAATVEAPHDTKNGIEPEHSIERPHPRSAK
jgi:hypothetical protein